MNFNFNNLKVNFFKIYVCADIKSPKSLANFNQLLDHLYVCTHTDCVRARTRLSTGKRQCRAFV